MLMRIGNGLKRGMAAALVGSVMLSGCVTTGSTSNANLTPAEQRLRAQSEDFNTTVVQGAVAGAVLGGLLGAFTKDKRNIVKYAAIGAGVGGATGYYVAKRKESFANEEARLDSMIVDVQGDNAKVAAMSNTTRSVIANDMARINRIEQDLAAGTMTRQEAKQQLALIDDNSEVLKGSLENLRKRQGEYEEASAEMAKGGDVSAQSLSAYNQEITNLQDQIASMENDLDDLIDRRGAVTLAG